MSKSNGDGVGGEETGKEKEDSRHKEQPSRPKRYFTQIAALIAAVINCATTKYQERDAEKAWDRKWRKLEVKGIWAAATVGLIAIVWSGVDAHKSRSEMQAEQRPWVSVSAFQPTMVVDTDRIEINITYAVHNSGHSPAVGGLAGTSVWVAIRANSFGEGLNSRAVCKKSEVASGYSIFPGDSPVLQTGVGIPLSWLENAIVDKMHGNAKVVPVMIGFCITYKDLGPAGKYHHTPYWLRLADFSNGNPGSLEYTGQAVPPDKLKLLQMPVFDMVPD